MYHTQLINIMLIMTIVLLFLFTLNVYSFDCTISNESSTVEEKKHIIKAYQYTSPLNQDGFGVCYAAALSTQLQSHGIRDVSFMHSSLLYSSQEKGEHKDKDGDYKFEGGWPCETFNLLKKHKYCKSYDFPLERKINNGELTSSSYNDYTSTLLDFILDNNVKRSDIATLTNNVKFLYDKLTQDCTPSPLSICPINELFIPTINELSDKNDTYNQKLKLIIDRIKKIIVLYAKIEVFLEALKSMDSVVSNLGSLYVDKNIYKNFNSKRDSSLFLLVDVKKNAIFRLDSIKQQCNNLIKQFNTSYSCRYSFRDLKDLLKESGVNFDVEKITDILSGHLADPESFFKKIEVLSHEINYNVKSIQRGGRDKKTKRRETNTLIIELFDRINSGLKSFVSSIERDIPVEEIKSEFNKSYSSTPNIKKVSEENKETIARICEYIANYFKPPILDFYFEDSFIPKKYAQILSFYFPLLSIDEILKTNTFQKYIQNFINDKKNEVNQCFSTNNSSFNQCISSLPTTSGLEREFTSMIIGINSPEYLRYLDQELPSDMISKLTFILGPDCMKNKYEIDEKLTCSKKKVYQSNKGFINFKKTLNENLESDRSIGLHVCSHFFRLPNEKIPNQNYYCETGDKDENGDDAYSLHAITIIGKRCKNGQLQYLMRNSWGTDCSQYTPNYEKNEECDYEKGDFWFDAKRLHNMTKSLDVIK